MTKGKSIAIAKYQRRSGIVDGEQPHPVDGEQPA